MPVDKKALALNKNSYDIMQATDNRKTINIGGVV